jgi:hypothetical protein
LDEVIYVDAQPTLVLDKPFQYMGDNQHTLDAAPVPALLGESGCACVGSTFDPEPGKTKA